MAKYIKQVAGYVEKKFHQSTNTGKIFEKDKTTLGAQRLVSKSKTIVSKADSNFIRTTNRVKQYKKFHNLGQTEEEFKYDDVQNTPSDINETKVTPLTDDLRDFAYYGSLEEVIRVALENIAQQFPGTITSLDSGDEIVNYGTKYYPLFNPFIYDLTHKRTDLGDEENIMRWLYISEFDNEGKEHAIAERFEIGVDDGTSTLANVQPITDYKVNFSIKSEICKRPLSYITINNSIVIRQIEMEESYNNQHDILWVCNKPNIVIRPKQEWIEKYFANLSGFDAILLRRDSKPLYSNVFATPVEDGINWRWVKRTYTLPSDKFGCVDISSPRYTSFLSSMIELAAVMDERYCDNLYVNMTHEAIKNFDANRAAVNNIQDTEDVIAGQARMRDILHIIARIFDDIKRSIDGFKMVNKVSYNGYNNVPDALLSDKLELLGWDVVTTLLPAANSDYNAGTEKWYPTQDRTKLTKEKTDIEFMRRLLLATNTIAKWKGTRHGIEMMMALFGLKLDEDYEISETYYSPKMLTEGEIQTTVEEIVQHNLEKSNALMEDVEDNPLTGCPLKTITVDGITKFYPYFDPKKTYDNTDVYYQSKGGWPKETMSQMRVAENFTSLFALNPRSVSVKDVFYVTNIMDFDNYRNVQNTDGTTAWDTVSEGEYTHLFILTRRSNDLTANVWKPIVLDKEYTDAKHKEYQTRVAKIASIVSYNKGNNPHTGFGVYDNGQEYINFLKKPFYSMNFDNNEEFREKGWNDTQWGVAKHDRKLWRVNDNNELTNGTTKYKVTDYTLVNDKNITLSLKDKGTIFRQYWDDVIYRYVSQVIPSTAILTIDFKK